MNHYSVGFRISFVLLLLLCEAGIVGHTLAQQSDNITLAKTVTPLRPEINDVVTVTLTLLGENRVCETVGQVPVDVVLVIDTSGSMAAGVESVLLGLVSWGPPKIEEAQKAAKAFVDELIETTDRVALVAFNSNAQLLSSLEDGHTKTRRQIARLETKGLTDLHAALVTGRTELTNRGRPEAQKVLIILSDGRSDPEEAIAAADAAKAAGLYVISVGVGSDVDNVLMEKIATSPGDYYISTIGTDLRDIYVSIAHEIKRAVGTTQIRLEHGYDTDKISVLPTSISNEGTLLESGHVVWEIPELQVEPVLFTYRATILTSGQFFIDTQDTITYLECEQTSKTLNVPASLQVFVPKPPLASLCPLPPLTLGEREINGCLLIIPVSALLLLGVLLWVLLRRRPAPSRDSTRPETRPEHTVSPKRQARPSLPPKGATIQHGRAPTTKPSKR